MTKKKVGRDKENDMRETRTRYVENKMVDCAYTREDVMSLVDNGNLEGAYDLLLLGGVIDYIGISGHGDEDEYYSLLNEIESMRNEVSTINDMDFEVWYRAKGDGKVRRMSAFHFLFDAEEFISHQHESIRDNYYIKNLNDRPKNEIF
jgi:hypothetical protein